MEKDVQRVLSQTHIHAELTKINIMSHLLQKFGDLIVSKEWKICTGFKEWLRKVK